MLASESADGAERRIALCGVGWAALAVALSGLFPLDNVDTFGHLAQGRQIAALGYVPSYDTFSFWKSAPSPWRNYEWASDLLGFWLYDAGGPNALIALKCVTLACAVVLLCALAWRLAGPRAAMLCALLLVIAVPAARFRFTERPHLVALPLCALYMHGLLSLVTAHGDDAHRKRKTLAVLGSVLVLHVAWVNLHGSHLLGLAVTAAFLVFAPASARASIAGALGLELVASCVSPYGPTIVIDALAHTLDPAYRAIVAEWQPWLPSDPLWLLVAPIAWSLALAAVAPSLWRRGPVERALLAVGFLLACATLRSLRFIDDLLLLAAPALAIGASTALSRPSPRALGAAGACAGVLVCAGAALAAPSLPPYAGIGLGASTALVPAASGAWLEHNARAPRVLAAIEDSWYVLFAAPQAKVLMDGRTPFYGVDHIAHISAIFSDADALTAVLDGYRVDCVLVRHTFAPQRALLARMRARPGWVLATVENRYALFVRQSLALKGGGQVRPVALGPDYDPGWLLQADAAREQQIRAELARLPPHQNRDGYASWVRAVLAIKPILRPGFGNGLRPPASAAEAAKLAQAQGWLARAARASGGVSVVHAYHALVAAARCDLEAAEHALTQARAEGDSRETLLGAQEIAIRRGERETVEAVLNAARALPEAEGDAWIAALEAMLRDPPRCP